MSYLIARDDPEHYEQGVPPRPVYYAGFEKDRPVWFFAAGRAIVMNEEMAKAVSIQLKKLGFTGHKIVSTSGLLTENKPYRKVTT